MDKCVDGNGKDNRTDRERRLGWHIITPSPHSRFPGWQFVAGHARTLFLGKIYQSRDPFQNLFLVPELNLNILESSQTSKLEDKSCGKAK